MPAPKGHAPYNKLGEGGKPRVYTDEILDKYADELLEWITVPTNYWVKDFCLQKNLDPSIMMDWSRRNERFARCYNVAKQWQESKIVQGCMTKGFNSGMSKFALANHHGWSERVETKVSGDAHNPLHAVLEIIQGESKDLIDRDEDYEDDDQ